MSPPDAPRCADEPGRFDAADRPQPLRGQGRLRARLPLPRVRDPPARGRGEARALASWAASRPSPTAGSRPSRSTPKRVSRLRAVREGLSRERDPVGAGLTPPTRRLHACNSRRRHHVASSRCPRMGGRIAVSGGGAEARREPLLVDTLRLQERVLAQDAHREQDRSVVAQTLLDRALDQVRVRAQQRELRRDGEAARARRCRSVRSWSRSRRSAGRSTARAARSARGGRPPPPRGRGRESRSSPSALAPLGDQRAEVRRELAGRRRLHCTTSSRRDRGALANGSRRQSSR